MSIPPHQPLPGYLLTQEPLAKIHYYHLLLRLGELFRGADTDEIPEWLVNATYDCTFDPDIQAYLERSASIENRWER